MKSEKCSRLLALSIAAILCVVSCASPEAPQTNTPQTGTTPDTPVTPPVTPPVTLPAASKVAGEAVAYESVLRAIPTKWIDAARTGLHIAYQHTSHGTHVSWRLFGLQNYKKDDATLFGITDRADPPDANKLDFKDYYGSSAGTLGEGISADLSNGVNIVAGQTDCDFVRATRLYLEDSHNANINVVMWSWCSIAGHSVADYLSGMQKLIDEYGQGGSKVGADKVRTVPVTFIFMTGHAESGSNVGTGKPRDQAKLITDYCEAHGYYCIDYYSIDSHDMDGKYWEDVDDNGYSSAAGRNFYLTWQEAHKKGEDWFETRTEPAPDGKIQPGEHNTQYITANRKAYAMWYILARVAGWDGN